jgi:precorrin-6B methylase 2
MRSLIVLGQTALVLGLASLTAFAVLAAEEKKDLDVVYVPTPPEVVEKMLELAGVTKDDVVYDLGCGDGRIVCTAARKFRCKAVGFDLDSERLKECAANKAKEPKDVQELITFENRDFFTVDLSKASVVTLYLLPELNVKLVPQIEKMKKGSRIVSHAFDMGEYKPEKKIEVTVKSEGNLEHDIFLWTIPLQKAATTKKE